jgi:curved DNA-binding protein
MQEFSVRIPPGISSGKKLRVTGKGMEGRNGGPPGDLYLQVSIKEHPIFTREGDDIAVEKEIAFSEVVLGTTVEVPTLEGPKKVKIPPGTQSNTKMRLRGQGVPHFRGSGRGDEYVKVVVKVPRRVTDKNRKLIEELAKDGI